MLNRILSEMEAPSIKEITDDLSLDELLGIIEDDIVNKSVIERTFTYKWKEYKYEYKLVWDNVSIEFYINWKNVSFCGMNIRKFITGAVADSVKDVVRNYIDE